MERQIAFVRWFAEHILAGYGIDARVEIGASQGAYYQQSRDGSNRRLRFGSECIKYYHDVGAREYASIRPVIGYIQHSDKGYKGLWRLVIHECAHAVVRRTHSKRAARPHGIEFIHAYWELAERYPFESITGLFDGPNPAREKYSGMDLVGRMVAINHNGKSVFGTVRVKSLDGIVVDGELVPWDLLDYATIM